MKNYFYVLLFALAVGCSSMAYRYTTSLNGEPSFYRNGLPYVEINNKDFQYSYTIIRSHQKEILLSVNIKNKTSKTINIDHTTFQLSSIDTKTLALPANPEVLLQNIDIETSQEQKRLEGDGFDATASLLDTSAAILEIGSIGNESEEEMLRREERTQQREERAKRRDDDIKDAKSNIHYLKSERDTVEKQFLRKTTLKKNESIKGIVSFKVANSLGQWKVVNTLSPSDDSHIFTIDRNTH